MLITLDDLLLLEPDLALVDAAGRGDGVRPDTASEISWAVSARTTSPHLPPLRGGEVVLVPPAVTEIIGHELPELYRQAADKGVRAVVFERGDLGADTTYPSRAGTVVLVWNGALSPETETTINRRLTECRSALYRIGSDLERNLADLAVAQSGLVSLVTVVSRITGLGVVVFAADGLCLASEPADNPLNSTKDRQDLSRVEHSLPFGATLMLGPLQPDQQVIARFVVDRIATAAGAALARDEATRPRGSRRTKAIGELLTGHATEIEQRAAALALDLDPDATFVVAVHRGAGSETLTRLLATLGTVHAANTENGHETTLVAIPRQQTLPEITRRVASVKRRWREEHGADEGTIALSSPTSGVFELPQAAREAAFLSSLQIQGLVTGNAASFESIEDLGAMRLLYQWRESSSLQEYVSASLGAIQDHDRHGILRATLRAFLDSGGSQVDAAQRLGIHRNTLAYRLRRISQLLDRDVTNPATWLSLHLAVRAVDMFDAVAGPS